MKNYLLYLKERLSLRSSVPPLLLAALFIAFIRLCASASLLTFFLFFITLICCVDLIRLNRFLFVNYSPFIRGFSALLLITLFLAGPLRSTAFLVLAVAAFIWFASGGPESEAPASVLRLCSALLMIFIALCIMEVFGIGLLPESLWPDLFRFGGVSK